MLRHNASCWSVITAIIAVLLVSGCAQGQSPQISSLMPPSGAAEIQVTITGTNLGSTAGTVTFNGTNAAPINWSSGSITVQVPTGATTGNVVVKVGGVSSNGLSFTVLNPGFTPTGSLTTARMFHTATQLNNGGALIVGGVDGFTWSPLTSAEVYSPSSGTFSPTGSLNAGRIFNSTTLLMNGTVLIAGGTDGNWDNIATAELYNPASGNFTYVGALNDPRGSHTATLLGSGQVLITGGVDSNGDYITSLAADAELYNPATGFFSSTGSLNTPRDSHTATLLNNGQVLIVGGNDINGNVLGSAEIYDPIAGTFTPTGSLNFPRAVHIAALLNNGQVLIAGGYDSNGNAVASAELYDPNSGTFSVTGSMVTPRYDGPWPAALLSNGTVLIAGGQDTNGNTLASAEVFDPGTGTFSIAGSMSTTRQSLTTTLLGNGQVLAVGGMDFYANVLASAELYQPSSLIPTGLVSIALTPSNLSIPAGTSQALTAIGTFNDGSTQSLASAAWSTSDNTILTVSNDITNHGVVLGVAAGSGTVSACAGSICGSTMMTVTPNITSLNPISGGVGTSVTITGIGFRSTQGSSTVTFNGAAATASSWSSNSIVVPIPAGAATTGDVVVTVNGVSSNGFPFVLPPIITNITPTIVSPGTQVTITGTGFGGSQGVGYVLLNNAYGLVVSWSDTQIVVAAQPGTFSGNLQVHQNGFDSNAVVFTSTSSSSSPAIMSLSPASGILGDQIVINGVNFGATQGSSVVTFTGATGGATAYAASWGNNSITAYVPYNATNGNLIVTVNGVPSNGVSFAVLIPTITSLSPNAGAPGTTVTIAGTNFGLIQGSNFVSFNGLIASVVAWSDSSITATVPSGASTGDVTVLRNGLYSSVNSNGLSFTVPQTSPSIASLSPVSGLSGTVVTISGANFGSTQGSSVLTFNGVAATPTAWTPNSISVPVPSGATSGSVVVTINGASSNGVNFTVPTLTSISVSPGNTSVAPGTSQPFNATGNYSDGSNQKLAAATWNSSASAVATINSNGLVTAVSQGQTTIQATVGSIVGSTALTVAPAVGSFASTGSLTTPRSSHTATLLTNGQVLIAGGQDSTSKNTNSAELFNSATSTFAATGNLNTARQGHAAVLLNNGMVLIAGGQDIHAVPLASAELYDPATGTFVSIGTLNTPRQYATATLLNNGKVLIAGGESSFGVLASAEIYDPTTAAFTATGNLNTARIYQSATLQSDGTVLIAGGETSGITALASAELYNPVTGTFTTLSATLNDARNSHTATLLSNGKVLLAQGFDNNSSVLGSAELYDPSSKTFAYTASPNTARNGSSATLLSNGTVLMAGGYGINLAELPAAEIYDPAAASFTTIGNVTTARKFHTATLLTSGKVLLAGGLDNNFRALGSTELYQPATTAPATLVSISINPSSVSIPLATAQRFTAVGTFSDSSTQTLASAAWTSSASNVAMVTSDSTNSGAVFAASAGTATINACAGSICGSVAVTVPSSQLTAITITPVNPVLATGSSVPLLATATFSDGGVQDFTAFVTWASSSPSTASVNAMTGVASGVAIGTATITATYGSTTATTTLTVPPPIASIAISPQSPSVAKGATQQFAATATYSDGSNSDITNSVQWISAAPQVATISSTGTLTAVAQGTTALSASSRGIVGSTTVTVTSPVPTISSVSPTSGTAGTQVSVSGSGFGNSQGTGTVWLGTGQGAIVSWSDTQVTATVASGSSSGTVRIQQNGADSNSVPFTVNTPTITGVTPASGTAGTQVSITGTGFGAAQGSGQVWLGTAVGQVNSWSDSQVVATVVTGSTSGAVQILQNGVWSNSIAFTVTSSPHVINITPTSGSAGSIVTIQGTGFGPYEGNGAVWIGGTYAYVQGWSDTVVVASVAASAVSGVVKVEQNGTWSNAVGFSVSGSLGTGGTSVTIVPNIINMVIGDTRTLQALGSNGQTMTGLTWTSSNTTVATLSTDDPPILTAIASGNATITAGSASADVTVFAGATLPLGTVIWSNPGDGSGVYNIVPAVPSSTGVADIFAQNNSGNVQAIRSDGTTAWTTNVGTNNLAIPIPDFQGGTTIYNANSFYRLDGMTGQPYPAYTQTASEQSYGDDLGYPAIHTDGTIFTTESNCSPQDCPFGAAEAGVTGSWVTGIDPSTGQPKFKAAARNSTSNFTITGNDNLCGPPGSGQQSYPPFLDGLIVAGDGYAYTSYFKFDSEASIQEAAEPYSAAAYPLIDELESDAVRNPPGPIISDVNAILATLNCTYSSQHLNISCADPSVLGRANAFLQIAIDAQQGNNQALLSDLNNFVAPVAQPLCSRSDSTTYEVHLLKVGTDGSSADTMVRQWQVTTNITYGRDPNNPWSYTQTQSAGVPSLQNSWLITNADQGALASWGVGLNSYCAAGTDQGCTSNVDGWTEYHLTNSAGSDVIWPAAVARQGAPVLPSLQLQDGTYVGIAFSYYGTYMVKFNTSGSVLGTAGGGNPQIATADGGFISGIVTFDANLNVTGQLASLPTQSWLGSAYTDGPVNQIAIPATALASNFAPWPWGGPNTATLQQWYPPLDPDYAIYNAFVDLINRLNSTTIVKDPNSSPPFASTTVSGLAQTYVFNWLGPNWTTKGFISYLTSTKPKFYNGVTSSYCHESLTPGWSIPCSTRQHIPGYQSVSDDFKNTDPLTEVDAETNTNSRGNPLLTFFRPTSILPNDAGQNLGNEALIFHEAIHGWTQIQDIPLLQKFYPPGGQGKRICAITVYIEDYVLSRSPGLDSTPLFCPSTNP